MSVPPMQSTIVEAGRKRIRNVPSHGMTKASRANLQIEEDLKASLNHVAELIRSEIIKRANTALGSPSWSDLFVRVKPILEQKIYVLIRDAATISYMLGAQYASKQILKKPMYLTTNDIDVIEQLADHYNERFCARVQLIVYHQSSTEQTYPNSLVNFTVVNLCSEALYRGTVEKVRELAD